MKNQSPESAAVSSFYDEFSKRLLRNYVYGNLRTKAATARVVSVVTDSTKSILDIGCGIGITADGYVSAAPWLRVLGVDISPRNIEIAKKLFPIEQIDFCVSDMQVPPQVCTYDIIALIDVYEHISRNDWPKFNLVLRSLLAESGCVVLTTPTSLHQSYLRKYKPEGLQIIDETVGLEDICRLADDIGAVLTLYEWMSIWRTNDYVHVILTRQPSYQQCMSSSAYAPFLSRVWRHLRGRLQRIHESRITRFRKRRVKHELNVDIED